MECKKVSVTGAWQADDKFVTVLMNPGLKICYRTVALLREDGEGKPSALHAVWAAAVS